MEKIKKPVFCQLNGTPGQMLRHRYALVCTGVFFVIVGTLSWGLNQILPMTILPFGYHKPALIKWKRYRLFEDETSVDDDYDHGVS